MWYSDMFMTHYIHCCLWYWMFSESKDEEKEPTEEEEEEEGENLFVYKFFHVHLPRKKNIRKKPRINYYYYYYYHWMIAADRFQSHSEHSILILKLKLFPKFNVVDFVLSISLVCFNFILDCCSWARLPYHIRTYASIRWKLGSIIIIGSLMCRINKIEFMYSWIWMYINIYAIRIQCICFPIKIYNFNDFSLTNALPFRLFVLL